MAAASFTNFWRPAYEIYSAVTWFVAGIFIWYVGGNHDDIFRNTRLLVIPCSIISIYQFSKCLALWNFKYRLNTILPFFVTAKKLAKNCKSLYLGRGFELQPIHASRVHKLTQMQKDEYSPPGLYKIFYSLFHQAKIEKTTSIEDQDKSFSEACYYLHGVSEKESRIQIPFQHESLHTLILGTTGAGKTVTLQNIIISLAAADYPIICIDPKGDLALRNRLYIEARRRGSKFYQFIPSKPRHSCRLNLLHSYTRTTQIASRIAALLPGTGDAATFRDFAWRAINSIVDGLDTAGSEITFKSLLKYIEGDIDDLLCRAIIAHLEKNSAQFPDWKSHSGLTRKANASASEVAPLLVKYFNDHISARKPSASISSLISIYTHDRAHYAKLITNIIPILQQLTAGVFADLLSPNYDDPTDHRPIINMDKVIAKNDVIYINLETLGDKVVGTALGSVALADITACAFDRYNSGKTSPIALIVDEAGEFINEPFIEILNKGRGAGFCAYMCSQTIADYTVRFGSAEHTQKILGNTNTTISFQLQDTVTSEFVSEKFGLTVSTSIERGRSLTPFTSSAGSDFTTAISLNEKSEEIYYVSPSSLASLPKLHYYMRTPTGQRIKGRVAIVPFTDEEKDWLNDLYSGNFLKQ